MLAVLKLKRKVERAAAGRLGQIAISGMVIGTVFMVVGAYPFILPGDNDFSLGKWLLDASMTVGGLSLLLVGAFEFCIEVYDAS